MSAKKGAKKKPLGAVMMPPGKSMTGRLSATTMKIESVKSVPGTGLKSAAPQKMVLKSNVAMAAELPK